MAGRRRICFAAGGDFLDLDHSWPTLQSAFEARGFDPVVIAWDDSTTTWSSYDAVLVNYTWGFVTRRDEFLEWAARVSELTLLVNSLAALHWGSSKRYLTDLSPEISIVPTEIVSPGSSWSPPAVDFVIKPAVSSGGTGAARYQRSELSRADDHVNRLHALGHDVVVQPYQTVVDEHGETALVFVAGEFSHAVQKGALLEPDVGEIDRLWERQAVESVVAQSDQIEFAERVLRCATRRVGDLAYARVDIIDGDTGPLLLELELIEPSLFLPEDGLAATDLARHLHFLLEG